MGVPAIRLSRPIKGAVVSESLRAWAAVRRCRYLLHRGLP